MRRSRPLTTLCALGAVGLLAGCSGTRFTPHDPGEEGALPVLHDADGADVVPAEAESGHVFGTAATVVSADDSGRLLAWSATVDAPTELATGDVTLEDPDDLTGADHFLCHGVSLTFLGATGSGDTGAPLAGLREAGDKVASAKTVTPVFSGASDDGADAGTVTTGKDGATAAEANCGVPDTDRLPLIEGDLAVGGTYRTAVLSAWPRDTDAAADPTVVRFDYPAAVPGASRDTDAPTSVYWGAADDTDTTDTTDGEEEGLS